MTKSINLLITAIKGKYKINEEQAHRVHDTALRLKSDYMDIDNESGNLILNCAYMITTLSDRVEGLQSELDNIKNQNQFNK